MSNIYFRVLITLHEVDPLHYTPQSATKLFNEIYEDPMKWWMQPEIQQAKDELCYQLQEP